jgi:hypothetical protein
MPCIWCKKEPKSYSREHCIPEALGCPQDLILHEVACAPCNNGLGFLDQALLKQFEIMAFTLGVPRKGGRAPSVDSWAAVRGWHDDGGPQLAVNGGPGDVSEQGQRLRAASKQNGISDIWVKSETAQMGFKQQFGNDRRFVPALYKIALNLVAKYFGSGVAAGSDYDHIRQFVRQDRAAPAMRALFSLALDGPIATYASGPQEKAGRAMPLFAVTILGLTFLLDLAADQPGLRDLHGCAMLHGERLVLLPPSSS